MKTLAAYSFPGNMRELRNLVERMVIDGTRPELERSHLYKKARALGLCGDKAEEDEG